MTFATGHRPLSPRASRAHRRLAASPISDRLAAGATMPPDLSAFLPPSVMDQGPTSSCDGHSGAAACFVSCGAVATLRSDSAPLLFVPSPRRLYRLALCHERMSKYEALVDAGASIDSIVWVATRYGVSPIQAPTPDGRFSDCTPETVIEEPTLAEIEEDGDAVLVEIDAHPIASTPGEAIASLQRGAAVQIAVPGGSRPFQKYPGGVMPPDTSNPPLDHAVLLYAWDEAKDEGRILNSWGAAWGESGSVRVSGDFLRRNTGDAFALSVRKAS